MEWRNERRVQVSHNVTKPCTSESRVGGRAIVAFDDLIFSSSDQDSDSRRLGRCFFISITGKNKVITSLITYHLPVKGTLPGST